MSGGRGSRRGGGRGRRHRRSALPGGLNLSFLDAISCGFGAIVLLLVLVKIGEPGLLEQARLDLDAEIARLEQRLVGLEEEAALLDRRVVTQRRERTTEEEQIGLLRGDLSDLQGAFAASSRDATVVDVLEARLEAAQQELTAEMERLQAREPYRPPPDAPVGGIPVDSEYIVFVIDTSGSMKQNAWPQLLRKMTETLDLYPRVEGIQVMNDMGQYLFSGYSGRWIPDTPGRRRIILEQLQSWNVFSNSSPVEGITKAIRTFARPDRRMSIYVFGDEFTGDSIDEVLETVDRLNPRDADGNPRVRIHGVGFPTVFSTPGISQITGIRFATLMRLLAERNGGAFVGLEGE